MSNQYPMGTYEEISEPTQQQVNEWINQLSQLPEQIENTVKKVANRQLETPVRDGAWTVKQLVHHIADASMNSYIHYKLALTEDNPTIKPYDEGRWAEMVDEDQHELTDSLQLLQAITNRWMKLLQTLTSDQYHNTFIHPTGGQKRLDRYLGFCVWHSEHHTAQIRNFLEANNS